MDPSFQVGFGSQGTVSSVVVQPDGKLLVAGAFADMDGSPGQNIGRLNADGTLDGSFATSTFDNSISKILLQADGTIIVAGSFSMINGTAHNGVARLNPDGSLDPSFGANGSVNPAAGAIVAIAAQLDGKVIIAVFSAGSNGTGGTTITRLNADGSLDTGFSVGGLSGSIIDALLVQPNGQVLVGGNLEVDSAIQSTGVVRLNPDGSLDKTFKAPALLGGFNDSLILQSDGKVIFAGSDFSNTTSSSLSIIRLNTDGSLDPSFNYRDGIDGYVEAAALQPNGQIVIAGVGNTDRGQIPLHLTRLNSDGSVDVSFDAGSGNVTGTPYVDIEALAIQPDGNIIVGGDFTFINGVGHASIARLLPSGGLDISFAARVGYADGVGIYSVALQPDGKILVGGAFSAVDGVPMGDFARLNPDGSIDGSFAAGTGAATDQGMSEYAGGVGPGPPVQSILVGPDGNLVVGGAFNYFDEVPDANIARINIDGSLDASFAATAAMTGFSTDQVDCTAFQSDGKILVGGKPEGVNGFGSLARLNTDGSLDSTFSLNPNRFSNSLASSPAAIVVQPDGKILIGGLFGISQTGIERANADGSLDASFNPTIGVGGYVSAIALQPDGKIIIGGAIGGVSEGNSNGVARLNGDGSLDASFNLGAVNQMGGITCLALQQDGRVLAGGGFSSYNGVPREGLVRLNADGSVDTSFDPVTTLQSGTNALALQPDGMVLAGGISVVRLCGDPPRPAFFKGAQNVDNEYFYLAFPNGTPFGFYSYNYYPYVYHRDLGFEYVIDAGDGRNGVYLYDFESGGFVYTNPGIFPCLYNFNVGSFIYYFAEPSRPGRYTSDPRVFVNLATGQYILD